MFYCFIYLYFCVRHLRAGCLLGAPQPHPPNSQLNNQQTGKLFISYFSLEGLGTGTYQCSAIDRYHSVLITRECACVVVPLIVS